jgi:hypothetical protein
MELVHDTKKQRCAASVMQETFADSIPVWTIYGPGNEFRKGYFVAALSFAFPPEQLPMPFLVSGADIRRVRRLLPRGLMKLEACERDDEDVLEVWM